MPVKPAVWLAALLCVVELLANPVTAAAPLPRKLLRLQGAATPDQQIAVMAQFRSAEAALLKKVSGGDAGEHQNMHETEHKAEPQRSGAAAKRSRSEAEPQRSGAGSNSISTLYIYIFLHHCVCTNDLLQHSLHAYTHWHHCMIS
jgi:hypothetical protein